MEHLKRAVLPLLLLLAGVTLIAIYLLQTRSASDGVIASPATRTPRATPADDPLPGPSPTSTPVSSPASTVVSAPTNTPQPPASAATTAPLPPPTRALADPGDLPLTYRDRFGVTGSARWAVLGWEAGLPFGSYANWNVQEDPFQPEGVTFWQLIRLREEGVYTPWEAIDRALAANPGSIWLIGNEPDVNIQDNVAPERYAELYHDLYTYIKEHDATALVAIGGVAQPTPLRRAYLDRVLNHYQEQYGHPLPVDIWNVHAFTLREEQDSWGVGIPPGMEDGLALHYEIDDHDNLSILRQNIIEFRAWMAERGYGDRPLLVSEYGILMPHEYGFPPEQIADFMRGSFDFFLNARNETGYPADDGRLVQWWFWFYLGESSGDWSSTYLYDLENADLTPLGEAYAEYVYEHAPAD